MKCNTCKYELDWVPDEHGYWCSNCQAMRLLV
jgi:anaerobic ribonucleoside-triphosphate reductase